MCGLATSCNLIPAANDHNYCMIAHLNQIELLSSIHLLAAHRAGETLHMIHLVHCLSYKVLRAKANVTAATLCTITSILG